MCPRKARPALACWAIFWAQLIFCACATTGADAQKASFGGVYMTNSKKVGLLATDKISAGLDSLFLLEAEFGENEFSVLSYVLANSEKISIDLLSDFGTDLGSLLYDNKRLELSSAIFPKRLRPEYVVLDFQNAFYEPGELKNIYEKAGLKFEASGGKSLGSGKSEVRKIFDGDRLVEEIEIVKKAQTVVTITNHLRRYKYVLTEIEN